MKKILLAAAFLLVAGYFTASAQRQTGPTTKVDGSGNLLVNCATGCSASAGFLDNSAFTAGTTPISITGGWYSTSPTNCTSGDACAPQLSIDRKLFTQDFQGTSPWVVSGTVTANQGGAPWSVSASGNFGVTQQTSPWVDNLTQIGSTNVLTGGVAGSLGVGGLAANGAALAGNPVLIGGSDTVHAEIIRTDGAGVLFVQGCGANGAAPSACGPFPVVGSVTIAAPSYSTGTVNYLSLNLAGGLRVDGSGVTQPVSGTVTANAGTGTFTVGGTVTANAGTGTFNIQSNASVNLAQVAGATVLTGNGTSAGDVRISVASDNSAITLWGHGATGSAPPANAVYQGGTDGTNLRGITVASAVNEAAATANGAQLAEKGPRWTVFSQPAVSTLATATKAAGGAGVRHVADCVSFSAVNNSTAATLVAGGFIVNLRDGASGAGTVIWTQRVSSAVTSTADFQVAGPFSICGLNLVGTAATAMTLEFNALVTNLFESVSISGYDVN